MSVTDYENELEELKKKLFLSTKKIIEKSTKGRVTQGELDSFHQCGVELFNKFERSLDEYGDKEYPINNNSAIRKVEDCINISETICCHWKAIRKIASNNNLFVAYPQETSYASIQRVIKERKPEMIIVIKTKFQEANLPTYGFDSYERHDGWKKPNYFYRQIIIGAVLFAIGLILSFVYPDLTNVQYLFLRGMYALGLSGISVACLQGTDIKVTWNIKNILLVNALGGAAIFILMYFFNPPSAPNV